MGVIRLTIAYDGSPFAGWAAQPGLRTVQGELEAALEALHIDKELAEAHTSLAALMWLHDWHWIEAQAEFKRSLQLVFKSDFFAINNVVL